MRQDLLDAAFSAWEADQAQAEQELVNRWRQLVLPTAVKHLSGKHDQKAHGYRFGEAPSPSRARQMARDGTWTDYVARARARQGGPSKAEIRRTQAAVNANATIKAEREKLAGKGRELQKTQQEYDKARSVHLAKMDELKQVGAKRDAYNKRIATIEARQDKRWDQLAKERAEGKHSIYSDEDPKWMKLEAERKKLTNQRDDLQLDRQKILDEAEVLRKKADEIRVRRLDRQAEYDNAQADYLRNTERARRVALLAGRQEAAAVRKQMLAEDGKAGTQLHAINKQIADINERMLDPDTDYAAFKKLSAEVADLSKKQADELQRSRTVRSRYLHQPEALQAKQNVSDYDKPGTSQITAWVDGHAEFSKLVGRNSLLEASGYEIGLMTRDTSGGSNSPDDGRAYARSGNVFMSSKNTGRKGVSTTIHELGHVLEYRDPGILAESLRWRDRRTQNESQQRLKDMFPQYNYNSSEVTKPDRFLSAFNPVLGAYAGKSYGGGASEVLSVGLQLYFENPVKFAKSDPDYFDFVYSVVRMGL